MTFPTPRAGSRSTGRSTTPTAASRLDGPGPGPAARRVAPSSSTAVPTRPSTRSSSPGSTWPSRGRRRSRPGAADLSWRIARDRPIPCRSRRRVNGKVQPASLRRDGSMSWTAGRARRWPSPTSVSLRPPRSTGSRSTGRACSAFERSSVRTKAGTSRSRDGQAAPVLGPLRPHAVQVGARTSPQAMLAPLRVTMP